MKNKPLVSVIVPTRNSERTIGNCLKSIVNQSYPNIEIIVVDNNSSDDTKEIAKKYTNFVFNRGPERSAQRNFGASKSKGEYFLFIDSDMELSNSVVGECVELTEGKTTNEIKVLGGVIIPEKSFGENFWAKCKELERSFYLGIDWIEAPRFFSSKIFREFRGYDETQTGTEDFDLPQRIKAKYGVNCILRIKSLILHDEGSLKLGYTLRKKFYYAKTAQKYTQIKANEVYFSKQSSIFQRYRLFFSNPKRLFKNPVLGVGMLFMKTLEFGAGGLGYVSR
jgi:glycosyltransferase involved in cell wall biosynthesis